MQPPKVVQQEVLRQKFVLFLAPHFFAGGIIAYQNRIKENLLTIPNNILNQSDAVSATVAEKMAYNTRVKFGVDFCISSTGFAGPTGGNADFPVGTIFLGISSIEKTISKRLNILSC